MRYPKNDGGNLLCMQLKCISETHLCRYVPQHEKILQTFCVHKPAQGLEQFPTNLMRWEAFFERKPLISGFFEPPLSPCVGVAFPCDFIVSQTICAQFCMCTLTLPFKNGNGSMGAAFTKAANHRFLHRSPCPSS